MAESTESETKLREAWAVALETSSMVGSVAIGQGSSLVAARQFRAPRNHGVEFIPTIDDLCKEQGCLPRDLRFVFVSIGPGSFTGLRLGVTVARMLALGSSAALTPVPSMEVIATNALTLANPPNRIAVWLDARRQRVFAVVADLCENEYRLCDEPIEIAPVDFLSQLAADCALMGEGVACHRELVERSGRRVLPESTWQPRAEIVFELGQRRASLGLFTPPRELIPFYIRLPDAEEKWAMRNSGKP